MSSLSSQILLLFFIIEFVLICSSLPNSSFQSKNGFLISSSAEEKFIKCCQKIGLKAKTIKDACQYPPKISLMERIEMGSHFAAYIGCYAAKKDNKVCCEKGGITGDCLDICNGANPPNANIKYLACSKGKIGVTINECNKQAGEGSEK